MTRHTYSFATKYFKYMNHKSKTLKNLKDDINDLS